MQKIEKNKIEEPKKSVSAKTNKKPKKEKRKKGKAFKVVLVIFLLTLSFFIGYIVRDKKVTENENERIITKKEKKEITFENSELKDAFAYSFDENNIYVLYSDNESKKIYGFDDNNREINSLIYKEGMIYFTEKDGEEKVYTKMIDLNKGNSKYDVENVDLEGDELTLVGCYDKYIYYFDSYSKVYKNKEYGYTLYKYDVQNKKKTVAIEGLVYDAKISSNGKIYYSKAYSKIVNKKVKILKSNIYAYSISEDKNLLVSSNKFNDYYGNITPYELLDIYKTYVIYKYDSRDKTYYFKYDIVTTNITNIISENRYDISCDNDNNYLICLKNIKSNKTDLLIYSVETNEKIYESNNVTNKDLISAYVIPNDKFNGLYINLAPDDTTNLFSLESQKFIDENSTLNNVVLKDN